MALRILEFFILLVTAWAVIFQMILPALWSQPLFPVFRKKRQILEKKIVAQSEKIELDRLKEKLNPTKQKDFV